MDIHFLDIIMYFVCLVLIYIFMAAISGGQYVEEMGILVTFMVIFVFTITYLIIFWACGVNWVDIPFMEWFHWFNFKW